MNAERGTRDTNKPLICFAVKEEAAEFRNMPASSDVEILITGMGRHNTEREFRRKLESFTPSLVLTCGFAGALNPELQVGDVLFDAEPGTGLAEALRTSGARPATFYCSTRVAVTPSEKSVLRSATGADVVEMESGIVREICREKKIPSATIRVISDAANESLPLDFNQLMTPDDKISFPKLGMALLKSPGSVPDLLKLQRNTQLGAQKLAEVLDNLLRSLRNSGT